MSINNYIRIGRAWINNYFGLVFSNKAVICHHGIKGQKWGQKNGPPYPIKKNRKSLQSYSIEDKSTGEIFHFAENSKLLNKRTFAGKGSKNKLKPETAIGLSETYGGKPSDWKHCKAEGTIDYYGEERKAEVHWFEEETVGKHKFKIKHWLED